MTQEELDALMGGDIDLDDLADEGEDTVKEEFSEEEIVAESQETAEKLEPAGYSEDTAHHWPLPATDENKMVHQLDDVTKESEEKASEIFDIIEGISNDLMEKEEEAQKTIDTLTSNGSTFTGIDLYEYYKLAWTANAIIWTAANGGTLTYYYDYQPWNNVQSGAAKHQVIMEGVSTFQFMSIGSILKIQICTGSTLVEDYSLCKEKTIF